MTVTSFDPTTGAPAGSVPETAPETVDELVARARAAAVRLAATAPVVRRAWSCAIADELEAHGEELVRLADLETGLGSSRLEGELRRAASQLRFYADVAVEGSWLDAAVDAATDDTPALARVNVPLGPVAVFGAGNFPFAFSVLGNDTASAIAAGCPVVVKGHPAHAVLSDRLAELATRALARAGAPDGTFALVSGYEAGAALVRADGIAAVAFTGSQAGGLALWRMANERPVVVPVYAEMGTVNPVVVTRAGARDAHAVAAGFTGSFTLGSGQFCTKPGLLLAPAGSGVPAAVAAALEAARPDPLLLTEGIATAARSAVTELQGAGARLLAVAGGDRSGWSAPAAVLQASPADLAPGSRLLEESFAPVVLVVEYADRDELAAAVAVLQGALVGTVVTGPEPALDPDLAPALELLQPKVGRLTVNDWPTGVAWTWAQQHGGPWPATSAPATTSVGAAALGRFVRPVAYQSTPDALLPPPVRADNPWAVPRRVDGVLQTIAANRP